MLNRESDGGTSAPSGPRAREPRDSIELTLTRIWERVLSVPEVHRDDDFFDLGGTSRQLLEVLGLLKTIWGREPRVRELMLAPTLRGMAGVVATTTPRAGGQALVVLNDAGHAAPLFLVHPVGGQVLCYLRLARALGQEERPLYGFEALGLRAGEEPLWSVEDLASAYAAELVAHHPDGPVWIAGYSFGGLVAYEIAQRLLREGRDVPGLFLLDTDARCRATPEATEPAIWRSLYRIVTPDGRAPLSLPKLRQLGEINAQVDAVLRALERERRMPEFLALLEHSDRRLWMKTAYAHYHAQFSYAPEPLRSPIRLVLYRCVENSGLLGWDCLVGETPTVYDIATNHLEILHEPYVSAIAYSIRTEMKRLRRG